MSGGGAVSLATDILEISLKPTDSERLICLCGESNTNLLYMEKRLGVRIQQRGHTFRILGNKAPAKKTAMLLQNLYNRTKNNQYLAPEDIHFNMQENTLAALGKDNREDSAQVAKDKQGAGTGSGFNSAPDHDGAPTIKTPRLRIEPRGENQKNYVADLRKNVVQFAIGPAGTGKTFLAVACALESLRQGKIDHICLVRPAVEAGETLGYLPGTLIQKINPYLRPLYDALHDMLGAEELNHHMEKNIIEVGALAYMRGRTLNNCCAILDEGQNCSREQIKMFLTRLGFNSNAVITGDLTQIDLQPLGSSGLAPAVQLLEDLEEVGVTRLNGGDIIRHPVVARIVEAYDLSEKKSKKK